jgi:hypothetical protein
LHSVVTNIESKQLEMPRAKTQRRQDLLRTDRGRTIASLGGGTTERIRLLVNFQIFSRFYLQLLTSDL